MPYSGMKVIKIENYKVKFQAFKGLHVGEGKSVWDFFLLIHLGKP